MKIKKLGGMSLNPGFRVWQSKRPIRNKARIGELGDRRKAGISRCGWQRGSRISHRISVTDSPWSSSSAVSIGEPGLALLPSTGPAVCASSQVHIQWHHIGDLELAVETGKL